MAYYLWKYTLRLIEQFYGHFLFIISMHSSDDWQLGNMHTVESLSDCSMISCRARRPWSVMKLQPLMSTRLSSFHFVCEGCYNINWRNVQNKCCEQCRQVKFMGTMTKWPIQKQTHRTVQNMQKNKTFRINIFLFFGFFHFIFLF